MSFYYRAEEAGHQKLASEFLCREIRDADEANLIDEEDMHVFGLKPMTDPLNLVCCNICKKPVKASQYIIHSELCRSLGLGQGAIMDLDGGMGHRKHSRKERKKLLPADANISALEKEGSESAYADYSASPAFPTNNQFEMVKLTKRNTYNVAPIPDDFTGVCPGVVDHSASLTHPSTKRSKLITGEGLLLTSDLEPSSAKAKIRYVPFPLASKIYYSQRNNHLRSALGYLYWEAVASSKEICNTVDHEMTKENVKQFDNSSQEESSQEQTNEIIGKKGKLKRKLHHEHQMDSHSLTSALKPDNNLAIFSSGKCLPAGGASNQFVVGSSVAWPQIAPVELTQKKLST
ncbi:uncharacterized protein LOC111445115 isoform X2 [Cucurbita moschata]|uniref:Uncharacterized protein LOC111445115 isoform X2 n=1 Tax=Cucurbita moschata TaxID=3662 RepID=A0A6J1FKT9_CUCMO|nr:uncharacterized protein LOC111445115 isoform X2 [Cucurbita moschata]XP_022939141.1 uncharacterized protein LOC111445115 isoform X2 [Cucurbita moschata]